MSQAVVIKSNKYGIHLVLSNEISFKALLDAIVEKFKESEKFFKGAKLAISFEGRKLTHDEEMAIIDAVTSNTSIEILCIVDHDPDREAYVKQQIRHLYSSRMWMVGLSFIAERFALARHLRVKQES